MNADGWGAGFFVEYETDPCLYVSTLPIWADANLTHLGRAIRSGSLVAAVRSATDPASVAQANTQPFSVDGLAFVHNGCVDRFRETVQRRLCDELSDARYQQVGGTSDSEHLLALIAHHLDRRSQGGVSALGAEELLHAAAAGVAQLSAWAIEAGTKAYFALALIDGDSMVALRSATHEEPPSLYLLNGPTALAPGVIVASEPLDDHPNWEPIRPGHAIVVRRGEAPKEVALSL